jgi:probable rRNA maturation factor
MSRPSKIPVSFHFQKAGRLLHRNKLKAFLEKQIKKSEYSLENLQIIFCDDKYLLNINNIYLKHNYYTDIITFDYSNKKKSISGELYISLDRVKENSALFSVSINKELHRVIFHGVLHLLGFKYKKSKDQALIRKKEDEWLFTYGL